MYDYAIIGNGIIGSSAARHLSAISDNVIVIGPHEPDEPWGEHVGVFASHYDQGRVTRALDSDAIWAELATAALAQNRDLEAASGVDFYYPGGAVQVGRSNQDADGYIPKTIAIADDLGTEYTSYSGSSYRDVCPLIHFPEDYTVLHEPTIAGYVNPRDLVKAQRVVAEQNGIKSLRQAITALDMTEDAVVITTENGQQIEARQVVVAAGAWSQFLLNHDLGLVPTPRTILLARLDSAETARLQSLPATIYYDGLPNPAMTGVYILPPIVYPDGYTYLKIGGKMKEIPVPQTPEELNAWFHGDGSKQEAAELEKELFALIPNLRIESLHVKPCVVTMTPNHKPLLRVLEDGKIVVAGGGCGAAAKSGSEIGRRATILTASPITNNPDKPNIILTGFMGTGKTTVGKLLAEQLGYAFVDTDVLIEETSGRSIASIFADLGEDAFRQMERDMADQLAGRKSHVIATGGRMMLDSYNADALGKTGHIRCLTAEPDNILNRVLGDDKRIERPLLKVRDPRQRIHDLLTERATQYAQFPQIGTDGVSPETIVHNLIASFS